MCDNSPKEGSSKSPLETMKSRFRYAKRRKRSNSKDTTFDIQFASNTADDDDDSLFVI